MNLRAVLLCHPHNPTGRIHPQSELAALAETVRCAVVATHDMELVATWASRVLVLDQGKVLADVTPRELFSIQTALA